MLNTYGNADKCFSLSPQSRAHSPRSFRSLFPFLPLGTEWEERTRGRYSFLNHHRLNCMICRPPPPPGVHVMIPSPNDICLRPIKTPHPDNVSTGIMSGWISSAPVRWAGEKLESETGGITSQAWLCAWSNAKWSLEEMFFFLVFFVSLQSCRDIELCEAFGAAGEPHWAISCLKTFILVLIVAVLGSGKH